jgi:very-short-patch-repair endonuclease
MLVAAESLHLLNRRRLAELLRERTGRPGTSKLLALLALEPAIVRSDLELLLTPIVRLAGLPRSLFNHPIPGTPFTVDLSWPDLRLVIELDSQRWHGDWERAAADRERDQVLALASHLCHRFVRSRLVDDPTGSAERLRLLYDRRAADLR